MASHPVFLSVILVLRNQAHQLEGILVEATKTLGLLASDYELIVVDNASQDNSLTTLKQLTREDGLPNLQVYALTKQVDLDTASWVGLENSLGDFVVAIDPMTENVDILPQMIELALSGADVVFAKNEIQTPQSLAYRTANGVFNLLYLWLNGINLINEAPKYRMLSKRLVNFILQHPQPAMTYRYLPAKGGFSSAHLTYRSPPRRTEVKRLSDGIDRGIRLLVSTTRAPMRIVTGLSIFGSIANLVYSVYVVAVGFLKSNVAPGWISLSLQQSGMFFLLSLVLFVLGEYILHMATLSSEGPLYHVAQELTSARITGRHKLNIEEVNPLLTHPQLPDGSSF